MQQICDSILIMPPCSLFPACPLDEEFYSPSVLHLVWPAEAMYQSSLNKYLFLVCYIVLKRKCYV